MVNILFQNIETLALDTLIHPAQQDFQKDKNLKHLVQVIIQEKNRVWLKQGSISSLDLKIVNAELLVNLKEIHGELNQEEVIQVLDIIEFLLILDIMNQVKFQKDLSKLLTVNKDLKEVP